jgi:flagellar biosynthesis/type III secretory pathway chaperone
MIPNELIQGLRDHLNAELVCYRALLVISERQQQALVANQVAKFSELIKQTEPNLNEQQRLRKLRERLLQRIAEVSGKSGAILSLTEVIGMSVEPFQSELKSRQLLIRDALERLRTVHERNQALLRQGLSLMRDLVRALTGDTDQRSYDRRGLDGGTRGQGRLINLAG